MDEAPEQVVEQDEELVHNEEERVSDDVEVVGETEVRIASPSYYEDDECNYALIADLKAWLKKLEVLIGYLEAELKVAKRYDEIRLIKYEISEAKKEIEYTRWKLNKELSKCGETEVLGAESKGPREPWLIVSLMKKYGIL